jgi:hypothetical protein
VLIACPNKTITRPGIRILNLIEKPPPRPKNCIPDQVPALSSEEAAVLTLTTTAPSPLLAAASLKLPHINFYRHAGDLELQGRVLLEGGTYLFRNVRTLPFLKTKI